MVKVERGQQKTGHGFQLRSTEVQRCTRYQGQLLGSLR